MLISIYQLTIFLIVLLKFLSRHRDWMVTVADACRSQNLDGIIRCDLIEKRSASGERFSTRMAVLVQR